MNLIESLMTLCSFMFRCRHWQTPVVEGKTHCPDCGDGVVFRWTVLRCEGCGLRRAGHYRFRQVVPAHRCCVGCGEEGVSYQYLNNPEFFQLRHALLSIEDDPYSERENRLQSCKAWFKETFTATVTWGEPTTSVRLLTTSGV